MQFRVVSWCVLLCILCLWGCASTTQGAGQKHVGDRGQKKQVPEMFKYIPADAVYAMANYKPFSRGLTRFMDTKEIAESLENTRRLIDRLPPEKVTMEHKFFRALAKVHKPYVSVSDGTIRVGLDPQGHVALYGIGIFPVLRVGLNNAKKFRTFFSEMEREMGHPLPTKTVGKTTFRVVDVDDFEIPIIITDRELVVGLTHDKFAADFVAYATGAKKFEKTMADDDRIKKTAMKHNLASQMPGFFDLERLGAAWLHTKETSLLRTTLSTLDLGLKEPSAECLSEFTTILKISPRVIVGVNSSSKTFSITTRLVSTHPFFASLARVLSPMGNAVAELRKNALLTAYLGVDFDKLLVAVREQERALDAAPFQCRDLAGVHDVVRSTREVLTELQSSMEGIQGGVVTISDATLDKSGDFRVVDGSLLARLNDPGSVFDLLTHVDSRFGCMGLKSDGRAASLILHPDDLEDISDAKVANFVMNKSYLGAAIGDVGLSQMKLAMNTSSQRSHLLGGTVDVDRWIQKFLDGAVTDKQLKKLGTSREKLKSGSFDWDVDVTKDGLFSRVMFKFAPQNKPKSK